LKIKKHFEREREKWVKIRTARIRAKIRVKTKRRVISLLISPLKTKTRTPRIKKIKIKMARRKNLANQRKKIERDQRETISMPPRIMTTMSRSNNVSKVKRRF